MPDGKHTEGVAGEGSRRKEQKVGEGVRTLWYDQEVGAKSRRRRFEQKVEGSRWSR